MLTRRLKPWFTGALSLVVVATALGAAASRPVRAQTTTDTQPSPVSATSLYLSNWQDMTAIWMASHLCQNDTNTSWGPRIAELHYDGGTTSNPANWDTNQIVDYSGFFLDNSTGTYYDNINNFQSTAYVNTSDQLISTYGDYSGSPIPITVQRNYVMPPNEPFLVVQYNLTNPNSTPVTWSVLDQVHLNNTNSSENVVGSYGTTSSGLPALTANMTASGQYYVVLGALQSPSSYQIGNDSDLTASDPTASAWAQFNGNGTLADNSSLSTPNMDMGFENTVTIPAGGTVSLYYYLTVRATASAAQDAANLATSQSGSYWFGAAANAAQNWLSKGSVVSTSDSGVNTEYERALLDIKNAQNPTLGTFVASTNPYGYGYKNWARDASFDAMALDLSGHYNSAAAYWNFMATHQNSNGTFATSWSSWDGSVVTNAVSPEYDSLGLFLYGVERHYALTGDTAFLNALWPQVEASANWLMDNINAQGFVPADASIWEINDQYYTWTQGWAVAGLRAAEAMAVAEGNQSLEDQWNGAASTILSAIQRSDASTNPGPGLWNASGGYYDQAISTSGTPTQTLDSATDMLIAFGVVDYASSRASSHIQAIRNALTQDTYGIARYQGDTYYYTSPYDVCGNEANAAQPPWPQMANWVGLYDLYSGSPSTTLSILQWDVATSGYGYMPQGEAVAVNTWTPVVSTMVEPYTASSFVMTALAYSAYEAGRGNILLQYPPEYNAGNYGSVNVTTNVANDLSQWTSIPYFLKRTQSTPGGSEMAAVKRVFITNDANNIYIRVDNMSGSLTGYDTTPLWAVTVYTQDFNQSPSSPTSADALYGRPLDRPMTYLLARWSNSNNYSVFKANGSGGWNFQKNETSVIAPQWDTSTGTVEVVVPIADVASSGSAGAGSWAYMDIGFAYQNPSTGTWYDNDYLQIHYRITASGTPSLYGDVE